MYNGFAGNGNGFGSALAEAARLLGGEVRGRQVLCPGPGHSRKDRSLSVRFDSATPGRYVVKSFADDDWRICRDHVGFLLGLEGGPPAANGRRRPPKGRPTATPTAINGTCDEQQLRKALWLWDRSRPARGTLVERYLTSRKIKLSALPQTLRFLSPTKPGCHPAMLVPFGLARETEPGQVKLERDKIRGVHLTLLLADGAGKANVEPNKIAVGPSAGNPIVLAPPGDGLSLAIAEGVEDALSIIAADTGMGVWASGGASRLPRLASCIPEHIESVTLFEDDDAAGRRNVNELARALARKDMEVRVVRGAR